MSAAAAVTQPSSVAGLARAIQLSVAPVFLLTGIAGLLNLFTGRLTRIVDRARNLQNALDRPEVVDRARMEAALQVQRRRTFLINRAILCTGITALLVAGVVAVLFISAVAALDLAVIVVPVFVLAMLSLISGLVLFLLEVQMAIRQNPHRYY
ncbi:DUF2721 domain-containing protein [Synechococcus sp. RSCCF101]|uniref:DUF2721 domain-containing protein n=1 Tax=Synechococcus sp. RSCCF101 TaxID=2511069 RepID=UPI001246E4FA|nr:DUF2721 domain-containing protein [Synechococcus sp. RSCCF101]QEY31263.1 DUF2721 domain-containing protein [Synechococcus sp. RSCCF101]